MNCISINYKTAESGFRSKFAFSEEERANIIRELTNSAAVNECVLLATCCRTEMYYCGGENTDKAVIKTLARHGGEDDIRPYINSYYGDNAIKHLFRVASGIASMVVGEDEILGQTKRAYAQACDLGAVGYTINKCFQSAIACAKRIKTDTELSKTSVSTATLAANKASEKGGKILVIGASGEIGSTVVKNLLSHKNVSVTVTVRRKNSGVIVLPEGVKAVDYADRYKEIALSQCVISATSSPHYTITKKGIAKHSIEGDKLFIDLAVPADIEESIDALGGFSRFGIDDFKEMAKNNNLSKMSSVAAAKAIIDEETDNLKKDLSFREFLGNAERVRGIMKSNPEKILYRLKSKLNAEQLQAALNALSDFEG